MSLFDFAKKELELAGLLSVEQDFYGGQTGKAVLELIDIFVNQEHIGMSGTLVADIFWKLANRKPLTPILGTDDEWIKTEEYLQNKRCPALFKTHESVCIYSEAIVFVDDTGSTWTGSCWLNSSDCETGDKSKMLPSSLQITKFPFVPKTFYINVVNFEIGDEIYPIVKDIQQLRPALEYYQ